MLLILSRPSDDDVRFLLPFLRERQVEHRWIDPGDFPARATISIGEDAGGALRHRVRFGGLPLQLERVTSVWFHRPTLAAPVAGSGERDPARCAAAASRPVLQGLAETLDATWLPGRPEAAVGAQNRIRQLALAPRLGFAMPRTVVSNDPRDLLDFWEACEGRVIARLPSRVGRVADRDRYCSMRAHAVRRRDLASYRALRHAPMILQEQVPSRLEVRVTVVGDRVFTCGIGAPESRGTHPDGRRAPHLLPAAVTARCVQLVQALGLCYGVIELVLRPDGEYVFLGLDPAGEWAFVQLSTGQPIADAVVDLLASPRRTERRPDPSAGAGPAAPPDAYRFEMRDVVGV